MTILIPNAKPNDKRLKVASYLLRMGRLVAFPTETVYGLGANALIEDAVLRVFKAKKRPPGNPLIVHVSSKRDVIRIARKVPPTAEKLIEAFWPGPLTIVLFRSPLVPDIVTGGRDTVAVRMPDHPIALELIARSKSLIVAPSANRSGRPSPTRAEHVVDDLGEAIDCVVDGGETPGGIESTIIDVTRTPPVILRPGAVSVEEIENVLGKVIINEREWPGAGYRHYSTDVELVLVEGDESGKETIRTAKEYLRRGLRVAVIGPEAPKEATIHIRVRKAEELARVLFSSLREVEKKVDVIVVRGVEEKGIGRAVMHRLRKAATEVRASKRLNNLNHKTSSAM